MWSHQKKFVPLVLLLSFYGFSSAEDDWMKKFLQARRSSMGSLRKYSTSEVKRLLPLERRLKKVSTVHWKAPVDVQAPPKRQRITPQPIPKRKQPSVKKKSIGTVSTEALLVKSRLAYESGKWEMAHRLYKMVQKADPQSGEAADRLERINRELR